MLSSEKQLQKSMEKAVLNDCLSSLIDDVAQISELSDRTSDVQFPQFALDYISRLKALEAGASVLDAVQNLELLLADENTSITSGEVLRPDLVCINPEQESVVIFELKKESQTGRQALTELLAYEQEIKNILPLVSNHDFNFVLVSPEWSTLMDHAVSSAITWSNWKILCLKPSGSDKQLRLETYIPTAWKVTGAVHFPESAIPCVTVCLYEKDAYSLKDGHVDSLPGETDKDFPDTRLFTALELMAREGDRTGGHGFAMLWRDHSSLSLCKYNITVCGISPFSLFQASREREDIHETDGQFVSKLDDYMRDYDPSGHSNSLMDIATTAYIILEEVAAPKLESFSVWSSERTTLEVRAEPLMCEFWGALGEYARSYVTSPAVRKHRRNTILNGLGNWRDPDVGVTLVQSFTRPDIFIDGNVRCSDAFRFGKLVGLDWILRHNIRQIDEAQLRCRFIWNRIELMAAMDEVRLLADAAENVSPPDEPLKFYADPTRGEESDLYALLDWLHQDFLQNSQVHNLFFDLGFEGSLVFDKHSSRFLDAPMSDKWIARISDKLIIAANVVISRYRQLYKESGLWGDLTQQYELLTRLFKLRKNFAVSRLSELNPKELMSYWEIILEASNHILEPVFHKHASVAAAPVDWDWLKQGVDEMRKSGVNNPGVTLLPNGQIVSGELSPMGIKFEMSIKNPEVEVVFMDQSNGIGYMRVVTWQDLKNGKVF